MTKAFDNHLILSKFTKQELVDELCTRDGVSSEHKYGAAVWGTSLSELNNGTAKFEIECTVLAIKK